MTLLGLRAETLVETSVNAVPPAMLLLFIGLFLVADPWGPDLRSTVVSQGLLVIPIVLVLLVTVVAARAIQADGRNAT